MYRQIWVVPLASRCAPSDVVNSVWSTAASSVIRFLDSFGGPGFFTSPIISPACGPLPHLWVTTGLPFYFSLRVGVRACVWQWCVMPGNAAASRFADSKDVDEEASELVIRLHAKSGPAHEGSVPDSSVCLPPPVTSMAVTVWHCPRGDAMLRLSPSLRPWFALVVPLTLLLRKS